MGLNKMKKLFTFIALVFSTAIYSNIYAQITPPPGAGDKDLGDKNIKTRSIELERVDREAHKTDKPAADSAEAKVEDKLAAKYAEIKTDFEQIQTSQDAVITAYQGGDKIDYAQIGKSALEINKSAARLNLNLFDAITDAQKETKTEEKSNRENETKRSIRDLIVDLDSSIGNFAASPMFQNLRLIDPKISIKTKVNLEKIINLSLLLNAEAKKMTNGEK